MADGAAEAAPAALPELTISQESQIGRACDMFSRQHLKCLRRHTPAECEAKEIFELLVMCTAEQAACKKQGEAYRKCFRALKGSGQFQGRNNCDAERAAAQEIAGPVAAKIFGFPLVGAAAEEP
eukprot:TRINITY_DN18694_c0_g1_i1.p1 TRINITY_DN18694_c0_g1~~TRINITY_DN18694_c0_g1_i1.p1  ORF type:complete len:141 (+),score=46.43 TRINITY_DN18694_c0_g1_i1:53-424(+)